MTEKAIQVDTRQKLGKHDEKHGGLERMGYTLLRSKLAFGDYAKLPPIVVDSKADIYELAMDIDQEHERFRAELVGARDLGVRMVVLVENEDGVRDLDGLRKWREPEASFRKRRAKMRYYGSRIAAACETMRERYGVEFAVCAPEDAADFVLDILGRGEHARLVGGGGG